MSARKTGPRTAIGVALAADRLTAILPDEDRAPGIPWTRMLAPAEPDGWSDLTAKLGELQALVGSRRTLFVALMGTLGQLRMVELPGVNEDEAARVIRRDPSRFFPMRSTELVVELEATGWRRRSPFVVAAAPRQLVETIGEAVRSIGWSLGGVVPAPLAWLARLSGASGSKELLIRLDDHIELLRGRRHRLTAYRRLPGRAAAPNVGATRDELATHGVERSPDAEVIGSESEAAALAARYVVHVVSPLLMPEDLRSGTQISARRSVRIRFGLAAALLVTAMAAELGGMRRERTRIASERSRIRHAVLESMAVRESLAAVRERLATLERTQAMPPRWSAVLADLAGALPPDAYLLALRADRDSLHVEGLATRAAPVFDALRTMIEFRDVRADAPIRQEVRDDRATSERFVLSAAMMPGSAR